MKQLQRQKETNKMQIVLRSVLFYSILFYSILFCSADPTAKAGDLVIGACHQAGQEQVDLGCAGSDFGGLLYVAHS
jgi:hypothetical protein